jgi:hypothetical protein
MIPLEIQDYILDFIQPYLTREDWRTCRLKESNSIQQLVRLLQKGKPRNHSWGVRYKDWSFYEKMRFSKMDMLEWTQLFPLNSLVFNIKR